MSRKYNKEDLLNAIDQHGLNYWEIVRNADLYVMNENAHFRLRALKRLLNWMERKVQEL